MKTIILGIGNPLLGDDGVGIHIIRQLQKTYQHADVYIDEAMTGGMNLLDAMTGFDRAILVDTIIDKSAAIGDIKQFNLKECSTVHSCNPHDVSLIEAIELAEKLGEKKIPQNIVVFGVVLHQMPMEFTEKLSPEISSVIQKAISMILSELPK